MKRVVKSNPYHRIYSVVIDDVFGERRIYSAEMEMRIKSQDFLLELNVQELPVGYVRPAMAFICDELLKELKAHRIDCGNIYTAGTKNLLLCFIKDVSSREREISQEILGPPKRIAFDENGNPTKQALGFAKSQNVEAKDIKIVNTPKGEYIAVEKKVKALDTKDILREIIPVIVKNTHFPKAMKWDSSGFYFARPVESVLVLFGNDSLKVKIGNVPLKKVSHEYPAEYLKRIQKEFQIDPDKRKEAIKKLILSAAKKLEADQCLDEALLEEVNFMVVSPSVFIGGFDEKFLELPEEVLKASMAKYQRLFPVLKKCRLINKFIAVINGKGRDIESVRKNFEKILDARLRDSMFFLKEDTKKPFSENVCQLKDLIFQKDLGNMSEKIGRLQELCLFLCEKLNIDAVLKESIKRAALFSKSDLVTHMVREFPSLQGIIGAEYALRSGENKDVSQAIQEHYLPQRTDDDLPMSLGGALLAICDRVDNLTGFLGKGAEISGSFDPYGIRRNSQGLVLIIKDKSLRFSLEELFDRAIELYGNKLSVPAKGLKDKIISYIKERIESLSGSIQPLELKEAVLSVRSSDVVDIFTRISELAKISNKRFFLEAAKVVERTSNILKGAKHDETMEVDEGLFKEDLEREVWKAYLNVKDSIEVLINKEDYVGATKEYAQAFYNVLHEFFDKVLVNAEDEKLRLNRLAMMKAINRLYADRVADLSKLPQIIVK